jgi:hypothetical protein
MPRHGAVTFGDIAGKLEFLRVECSECSWAAQYRLMRLMKECGEDATLTDWLGKLTAECPRRQAGNVNAPCAARFPDLPRLSDRSRRRPLRPVR